MSTPSPFDWIAKAVFFGAAAFGMSLGAFALEPRCGAQVAQERAEDEDPAVLLVRVLQPQGRQAKGMEDFEFLLWDRQRNLIFRGLTDAEGEARVDLDALPKSIYDADGQIAITGQAQQPGYQEITAEVRPAYRSRSGAPIDHAAGLLLAAVPGATIGGVIVDASGRGVPAEVSVRRWSPGRNGERLELIAEDWSDEQGRFLLHVEQAGTVQVLARAAGVGRALLRDFEVVLGATSGPVELKLAGDGILRGALVDGAGKPIPDWPLVAIRSGLDGEAGSSVYFSPAESRAMAGSEGLPWATFRTDEQGCFDLPGLQSGEFTLYAESKRADGARTQVTPEAIVADGSTNRLVFGRPILAVSLRNREGAGYQNSDGGRASANGSVLRRWPRRPVLRVVESVVHGGLEALGSTFLKGTKLSDGEFTFEGVPGRRYWVSVLGGPFKPRWSEVQLPREGGRVEVALAATSETSHGEMVVRVFDGDVELGGGKYFYPDFDVFLEDMETGIVLVQSREYQRAYPYIFRVPAGRYRVVARGNAADDHQHGNVLREREKGCATEVVEIQGNQSLAVRLKFREGGRIRLQLEGEPHPEDLAAVYRELPSLHGRENLFEDYNSQFAIESAGSAVVMLHRPGARPVPAIRTAPPRWSFGWGDYRTRVWRLGEEDVSSILTAGIYTLVAEMPAGRVVTEKVEIVGGETLELTLRFPD